MECKEKSARASLDSEVLQLLLVSERSRVLSYITRHFPQSLSAVMEPADVLQEVYVETARRLNEFVPTDETSCFRWLVTIARSQIAIALRVHGRIKRGGKSKHMRQTDSIVALLSELMTDGKTPSRSAARHELVAAVQRAIGHLKEDARMAVMLHHIQKMTCTEIAQRMGRSEGAVQQLCYRGVQQMRRELRSASLFV